jgi:hypothetical protein
MIHVHNGSGCRPADSVFADYGDGIGDGSGDAVGFGALGLGMGHGYSSGAGYNNAERCGEGIGEAGTNPRN